MLTLAIDTSTSVGGVAIVDDDRLVAACALNVKRTHSERLMSMVERVVSDSDLKVRDIEAIACGVGPGSFTGVRIGVSAAKCLSYTLNIPIVGVCGLDAMAFSVPSDGTVVSMIDAKHSRTFTASFTYQGAGKEPLRICDYSLEPVSQTIEKTLRLKRPYLFLGDGSLAYSQMLYESFGDDLYLMPHAMSVVSPCSVGVLGNVMMAAGHFDDPALLLPFYMRESEPEIKLAGRENS